MGKIRDYKEFGDSIIYKIELEEQEALQIAGNMDNIKMFSPEHCNTEADIIEKGIKGSTKHFVIPTRFKNKSKKKPLEVSYQTLDLDSKVIFIYGINY